ncbi:MAG: phage/plasmid primase, P4 family [Desulfitobacteriaceae bacterium]
MVCTNSLQQDEAEINKNNKSHTNTEMLEAALSYAARGWHVFPVKERSKQPMVADWPNVASIDPEQAVEWWTKWPKANIGIVTGRISGLLVLDVDISKEDGEATLRELEEKNAVLPDTIEAITGGGGRHIFFAYPDNVEIKNRVAFAPGLDIRSNGGYVAAAPSIHESGQRYTWRPELALEKNQPAECPVWLLQLITGASSGTKAQESAGVKQEATIRKGARNDSLYRLAGRLRRDGLKRFEIEAVLLRVNTEECNPPLPQGEVKKIAESITRHDPGEFLNGTFPYNMTETGNAELLANRLSGDFIWVPERKTWMQWNGKYWQETIRGEIIQAAIKCFRDARKGAVTIDDERHKTKIENWLLRSEGKRNIDSAIALMMSYPGIAKSVSELDNNDMLLNVLNGTVDLITGQLRAHDRVDCITRCCNAEFLPEGKSEVWEKFLTEIFPENQETIRYVQKLMGYCLTGRISEEELYILKGGGRNGKTKLVETIKYIMGGYAITGSPDTLLAKEGKELACGVARFDRARLVLMSEPDTGKKLSDNAVKSLTGGDTIVARFLYGREFEFQMKGKIIMLTNHEVKVIGTDHGLWSRLVTIPFLYTVPKEKIDKQLQEKLIKEAPGILSWCVEGCLSWQREGLRHTEKMGESKEEYRRNQDVIELFIEEHCVINNSAREPIQDVYQRFCKWAMINGERSISRRELSKRLREKGFCIKRGTGGIWNCIGLWLTANATIVDSLPWGEEEN